MKLQRCKISKYTTFSGIQYENLTISYQVYGQKLHSAPVIILNHALTGNSDLQSKKYGWWRGLLGEEKLFNTNEYTIIAFNILGNGFDGNFINEFRDFSLKDIAKLFILTLEKLKIESVFAIVGGSLGGSLAWEFATLKEGYLKFLIPIASDNVASNWLIAFTHSQESILLNSEKPLQDARKMAMLFYRNPNSVARKFKREKDKEGVYEVESWLEYHGEKLKKRYAVQSYLMMNHLMKTVDVGLDEMKKIDAKVIQIGVSSDLLYPKDEILKTKMDLDELNIENEYFEIKSSDGHDAFFIEQKQIEKFLTHIF